MSDLSNTPQINLSKDPPLLRVFEPLVSAQLREEEKESRERKHWHASDLGYCIGGAYYDMIAHKDPLLEKAETNDSTLMTFAIGHIAHDWLEETAEKAKVCVAREDALKVFDKVLNASGRGDLIIEIGEHRILYDIKTVHPGVFYWNEKRGWKSSDAHQQQLHFYFDRLKEKFNLTLMANAYVSKDFKDGLKMQEVLVEYNPDLCKKNERFFLDLEKARKTKTPPEVEEDIIFNEEKGVYELNWKSKYCSYHDLCTGNPNWKKEAEAEIRQKNKGF